MSMTYEDIGRCPITRACWFCLNFGFIFNPSRPRFLRAVSSKPQYVIARMDEARHHFRRPDGNVELLDLSRHLAGDPVGKSIIRFCVPIQLRGRP